MAGKEIDINSVLDLMLDADVLSLARNGELTLSVPMTVFDRMNLDGVEDEIVAAAREAIRSSVLLGLLNRSVQGQR
jgi:hypothetical protein